MTNKVLLFAYEYKGEFYAETIIDDLESRLSGLEYGDVYEGEYQIWEYPSGKIFNIEPDRKVDDKYYYYVPYNTSGTIWLPKLTLLKTDKERVQEAYKQFSSIPKKQSFAQTSAKWYKPWKTIFKKWFKK